ncbi:MAG: DUF2066 domain-containing protein [Hyphomicrobium sp.]|jgi:hypothetical protein
MRSTVDAARIAVLTALAAVSAATATAAWAKPGADRAYTIANYPVEARAANAVAAKDTAIADGQKAAFRSLLKRIVPVTAYRDMERLASVDPATLIDGVAVRSERNSATEYIANLDFSFQANEVRDLLNRQGVPFVDTQAPATIIVPLTRDAKAAAGPAGEFRAASGTWGTVWPTLDLQNSVAPLKAEALKPEIGPDALRGLYEEASLSASVMTLAAAYGTDQIIVAVAEVDTEGGKVNVLLAGQDSAGPFALKRAYRLSDGDLAYTLELAAVVSQGVVEGRWKAVSSGGAIPAAAASANPYGAAIGGGDEVSFDAQFGGTGEWNAMRRVLLEAPGIDDIRIGSISSDRASVSVKYPGGGPALAQALATYGISLTDTGGLWVMRQSR